MHLDNAVWKETLVSVALNSLLQAAGAPTFMMTLGLTKVMRARVRASLLAHRVWSGNGVLAALRHGLPWRAPILAMTAITLLVPTGFAVASLPGFMPMTRAGYVVFNGAFGALVGLTMTPLIVLAALADRPV